MPRCTIQCKEKEKDIFAHVNKKHCGQVCVADQIWNNRAWLSVSLQLSLSLSFYLCLVLFRASTQPLFRQAIARDWINVLMEEAEKPRTPERRWCVFADVYFVMHNQLIAANTTSAPPTLRLLHPEYFLRLFTSPNEQSAVKKDKQLFAERSLECRGKNSHFTLAKTNTTSHAFKGCVDFAI